MDTFSQALIEELAQPRPGPLVSIYMAFTSLGMPKVRLQWNNLVSHAEKQLAAKGLAPMEALSMVSPPDEFFQTKKAKSQGKKGIAGFFAPHFARTVFLPQMPVDSAYCGSEFHVLPLVTMLRQTGNFHILALSGKKARLICVEGGVARAIETPEMPEGESAALATHDRDDYLGLHTTHGGAVGGHGAQFYGHGIGIDDKKSDLALYFRQVDRAIHKHLAGHDGPLILATVSPNAPIYREVNTHGGLTSAFIPGNPDRVTNQNLAQTAIPLLEPFFQKSQEKLIKRLTGGFGLGLVEEDIRHLEHQSLQGKVEILVLAEDMEFGSALKSDPLSKPTQIANRLICQTIAHRGEVVITNPRELEGHKLPCGLLRHGKRAICPVV